MDQPKAKASLSSARQRLVKIMQNLNYGHLENLRIEFGEPTFDADVNVVKDIKLGGANGPRTELQLSDFAFRAEVAKLFHHFYRFRSGRVTFLQIRAGLEAIRLLSLPARSIPSGRPHE